MAHASEPPAAAGPRLLPHAPAELTGARLHRLGEGVGKVVYASPHWVVKRERSPSAIIALILLYKFLRGCEGLLLPQRLSQRWREHPSRLIQALRLAVQSVVRVIPLPLWYATHTGAVLRTYLHRDAQGEDIAAALFRDSNLLPRRIAFPPVRVAVAGWPGWLTVTEATERVETTLYAHLAELAREGRWDEFEAWLERLMEFRQSGWSHGAFSLDAHLKNFGIISGRIVLIDWGGLTSRWQEIERRLGHEAAARLGPHERLGMHRMLARRPDIAARFDMRWRSSVNLETIRRLWPAEPL
jgi:hypothetical protein